MLGDGPKPRTSGRGPCTPRSRRKLIKVDAADLTMIANL
jgi:hypothetical protein